jgi:hypothetical protein
MKLVYMIELASPRTARKFLDAPHMPMYASLPASQGTPFFSSISSSMSADFCGAATLPQ